MVDPGAIEPVPVFPLPETVLFPRTVLPLHVFEPRYRRLVQDAEAGEGLIAVALLKPGWEEDYEGSPSFEPVATVGRMEDLERLPDGRYLLRLVGERRVELGEVLLEEPYRLVRAAPIPEDRVDDEHPGLRAAKLELLAAQACLMRELGEHGGDSIVLQEQISFEAAVNGVCANLPVPPARRQGLLEEGDLVQRLQRASALLNDVLANVMRLRGLGESGRELN